MCQNVKLSDVSLGARPRYSLVVDEDVKKPTNQTKVITINLKCPSYGLKADATNEGPELETC